MTEAESKHDDIPQDVWSTVCTQLTGATPISLHFVRAVAAGLIMAERERCAKVADGLTKASTPGMPLFGAGMCNAADQIATAIRYPTPPNGDVRG